jgi:hypothetical protein
MYRNDTRLITGSSDMELRVYDLHWLTDAERQMNKENAMNNKSDILDQISNGVDGNFAQWHQANVCFCYCFLKIV